MSEAPTAGRDVSSQNVKGLAVSDDVVSEWFIREILPHEAILMHYLQSNWRNASDIPDLRQEIYARVFEAARERIPDSPKRFLFVCARNLLIDLVRHEQVVPMETFADFETLDIATDAPGPDRQLMEREDRTRLEAALEKLPPRTREAIALAYFEGLSATEIAKRMGIARPTAARFIARGGLILADILYGPSNDQSTKSC